VKATSQGETIEQALANLREVVEVYLEEQPAPGDTTEAAGDLLRRPRPSVTSRLPRGVSEKQAVTALERAGFLRRSG
jgi:hypothetical protein